MPLPEAEAVAADGGDGTEGPSGRSANRGNDNTGTSILRLRTATAFSLPHMITLVAAAADEIATTISSSSSCSTTITPTVLAIHGLDTAIADTQRRAGVVAARATTQHMRRLLVDLAAVGSESSSGFFSGQEPEMVLATESGTGDRGGTRMERGEQRCERPGTAVLLVAGRPASVVAATASAFAAGSHGSGEDGDGENGRNAAGYRLRGNRNQDSGKGAEYGVWAEEMEGCADVVMVVGRAGVGSRGRGGGEDIVVEVVKDRTGNGTGKWCVL